MTISSTDRLAQYVGSGTSTFSFQFKVFQASDLFVVKQDDSTGVETMLTLTTDYTVTLNADQNYNPGGNVITTSPVAVGYNLTITSDLENLQPTDLSNQGGFYPDVINNSLDRATIQIQQLADVTSRTMVTPISDGLDNDLELPSAAERANKHLAFDATGKPIAVDAGFPDLTADAGEVLAGAVSGPAIQATFRTLVASDLPALNVITAPTGNVNLNSKKITNLLTPVDSTDAATKGYIDGIPFSGTANKVLATPNGSTGSATFRSLVGADLPTLNLVPAPVASVSLNSQKITSLLTPTDATDAVNKAYVDALPLYNLNPQTGISATNLQSTRFQIEVDVNSIDLRRLAIIDTTLTIGSCSVGSNFIRLKNTNATSSIKVMVLWAALNWEANPPGISNLVSPDSVPDMPWAYTRGVFVQGVATLAASSANGYFQGTGSGWPAGVYSDQSSSGTTAFSGAATATIKMWILRLT